MTDSVGGSRQSVKEKSSDFKLQGSSFTGLLATLSGDLVTCYTIIYFTKCQYLATVILLNSLK